MNTIKILLIALLLSPPVFAQMQLFTDYETVAASQSTQTLGPTGGSGDVIEKLIIIPATTGAGSVALLDHTTSYSVFVSGTLADLTPIVIPLGARSKLGAWKVTTRANVSVIAVGKFK